MKAVPARGVYLGPDREFRTGITRESVLLLVCVLAVAAVLFGYGAWVNSLWPGRGLVYFLPGGLLAGAGLAHVAARGSRKVLLSSRGVGFEKGGRWTRMPWSDVDVYHRAASGRKWFRETRLGCGSNLFLVDSLSFPAYEEIVQHLDAVLQPRRDRYARTHDLG